MQDGRYAFRGKKHLLLPLLFLLPQLAITVVFFFYPAGEALMGSFYMEDSFGLSKEFVGLDNFITLFSDPSYLETLRLTLVFSLATIVLTMGTALLFAVLADQVNWGGTLYKSMLIIPYAVAPPLAGVLWLFLFNPSGGVLTELLHHFGYTWNHKINGNQALFLLIVSASWKQISYNFLFFLAGLHAIPRSLIEAAAIDGASPWRRFRTIIFPLLSPTSFFLLVVNTIYTLFETFGIVHAVTQGGPSKATETLIYKVFNDGFIGLDFGGSSAQSVVLILHRHGPDLPPVPLRGTQGDLLGQGTRIVVEKKGLGKAIGHAFLWFGIAIVLFPLYIALVATTHTFDVLIGSTPVSYGGEFLKNFTTVLTQGLKAAGGIPVWVMMANSLVMALGIAIGKIAISITAAYAIVYFRFPGRELCFVLIFITLMMPVEVRIVPTFQVAANLNFIDSYLGLVLPLIASATATFLYRQMFMTIPAELLEAARIDGAGPWRFFVDVVLPLSRTNTAALFVVLFIYGWNQYLWPLLVTNQESMYTIVMGIQRMVNIPDAVPEWNLIMAVALLGMLPPLLVVLGMQKLFVRGLVETEK